MPDGIGPEMQPKPTDAPGATENGLPGADVPPMAPDVGEMLRAQQGRLQALQLQVAKEVAFREQLCLEQLTQVLDKYNCVMQVRDGMVHIVTKR